MTLYKVTEQVDVTKFYDKDNCHLYELVQYQCEANKSNIECSPFVRLFLKCKGIPTVEVTPEYNEDGEVISNDCDYSK
ncbi:hypothetical protein K501DRAFT_248275 [Backusella circina FSU 941]|nr:hypothetical protein K501DRAFT_248275 [Backusella circina FSU 941]